MRFSASSLIVLDAPHLRIVSVEAEEAYSESRAALDAGKTTQVTRSGPKARHLLAGIARCGVCGGPMQGDIRRGVRYYRCGRARDAGLTVCNNNLLRPVSEADRAVVGAVSRYLEDDVVVRVIREVKKQLAEQGKKSSGELPRLEQEKKNLEKEIERLAEAVATTDNVAVLAKKLSERQAQLNELVTRIQVLKTSPNVIDLEVRRLEKATRERLAKLHEMMHGDIQEARQVLQSVLESGLTMTPRETSSGREYAITGRLVLGDALAAGTTPSPDQARGLRVAHSLRPRRDS